MAPLLRLEPTRTDWGERVKGMDNSYERMWFAGEWYALYDCVHVRSLVDSGPYVGKIMRLYEEEDGRKMMRVRWFFKAGELPIAVSKQLSERDRRELYIAQGSVKGVENANVVETIIGKVTVLCTAKAPRNPQPSQQQVNDAHYYFSRAYDAAQRKLVKMDRLDKVLAPKLFNKPEWVLPPAVENETWEELKSPTSVADFGKATRKRPLEDAQEIQDTTIRKPKGESQSFSRAVAGSSSWETGATWP